MRGGKTCRLVSVQEQIDPFESVRTASLEDIEFVAKFVPVGVGVAFEGSACVVWSVAISHGGMREKPRRSQRMQVMPTDVLLTLSLRSYRIAGLVTSISCGTNGRDGRDTPGYDVNIERPYEGRLV
jgi:hypothetical protein